MSSMLTLFANDPWTKELVLQYLETKERKLILKEPVFANTRWKFPSPPHTVYSTLTPPLIYRVKDV